jgi:peptidoglycan/xylan/chitin deacetylase (PgdA/CDA1 family)
MMRTKEVVRRLVSRCLVGSGVTALGRRSASRNGALIFYGHRVLDHSEAFLESLSPRWLDEQVAYLARHYEIIGMDQLVRCFEEQIPVPAKSVVLTFDDGFRDNLENALPILERHRAPATVFLVTGSIATGRLPWSQRLGFLFEHTVKSELSDPLMHGEADISTPIGRRHTYATVKRPLSEMPRVKREETLERLATSLGVDPPVNRMLSWNDTRDMMARGVEFGAHTYSHPLLARIPMDEAEEEMRRSREDLRTELGIQRPYFCFPGGSVNAALMSLVRSLGFRSGFLPNKTQRLNNLETADAYSLSRRGLPNAPAYVLEAATDGPVDQLRRQLRRKDSGIARGVR